MDVIQEGKGKLVGWRDPDEHRKWVAENKSRELKDKTCTPKEAVEKYVKDGDYIASGGFGHVRVSMSIVYEIIRQGRKNLTMAGKTAVHDQDILIGAGCVNKVEAAYSFGHELRGLSPASRRAVESGACEVVAEISNAGYQWRFLGGMMGVPFIPARNMLGTDTLLHSSSKVVKDPFSGKPITLIPSCNPDVVLLHVHRCDVYGNAQIDGIAVEDFELARAARRLIITTEEIISEEQIREKPYLTTVPFIYADAVIEMPYGSHPCLMPYKYYFDEEVIGEWLKMSKTAEGAKEYFDKYVFSVKTFEEYLGLCGGIERLNYLKRVEDMRAPLTAPWIK